MKKENSVVGFIASVLGLVLAIGAIVFVIASVAEPEGKGGEHAADSGSGHDAVSPSHAPAPAQH